MSNDWLVKLAARQPTDIEQFEAAVAELPPEEIMELARTEEFSTHGSYLDSFSEKIASADQMGREMAHLYGDTLEKQAFLPAAATVLRGAAGMMMRNPSKALALGGAGVGAAQGLIRDPGYDEQGNKKSRLGAAAMGAAVGGALGYGVGSIKAVQSGVRGAGKGLSKHVRSTSWRNSAHPSLAPALTAEQQAAKAAKYEKWQADLAAKPNTSNPEWVARHQAAPHLQAAPAAATAAPAAVPPAAATAAPAAVPPTAVPPTAVTPDRAQIAKDLSGYRTSALGRTKPSTLPAAVTPADPKELFPKERSMFPDDYKPPSMWDIWKNASQKTAGLMGVRRFLIKEAAMRARFRKTADLQGRIGETRNILDTKTASALWPLTIGGAGIGAARGLIRNPGYDTKGNKKSRLGAAVKGTVAGGALGYGIGTAGNIFRKRTAQNASTMKLLQETHAPAASALHQTEPLASKSVTTAEALAEARREARKAADYELLRTELRARKSVTPAAATPDRAQIAKDLSSYRKSGTESLPKPLSATQQRKLNYLQNQHKKELEAKAKAARKQVEANKLRGGPIPEGVKLAQVRARFRKTAVLLPKLPGGSMPRGAGFVGLLRGGIRGPVPRPPARLFDAPAWTHPLPSSPLVKSAENMPRLDTRSGILSSALRRLSTRVG